MLLGGFILAIKDDETQNRAWKVRFIVQEFLKKENVNSY